MSIEFFPNQLFAISFFLCLIVFTWVAAWWDARTLTIPKTLTYPMAGAGLVVNMIRGGWVGALPEGELWLFDSPSILLGVIDGLLFAFAGLFTGFSILFLMWVLRTCGGGDVKLFAALGAWVGSWWVLCILIFTLPILFVLTLCHMVIRGSAKKAHATGSSQDDEGTGGRKRNIPKIRIAYSLPVAISLLIVLIRELRVASEMSFLSG